MGIKGKKTALPAKFYSSLVFYDNKRVSKYIQDHAHDRKTICSLLGNTLYYNDVGYGVKRLLFYSMAKEGNISVVFSIDAL